MTGVQPNIRDAQQTPLFDTIAYPITTMLANRLTFFDVRTQSANGVNISNMPRAGMLPAPQRFSCFGMSFTPVGVLPADLVSFKQLYTARLLVDGKTMLEGPIEAFPTMDGPYGIAATFALGQDYGIPIEAGSPVSVELNGTGFAPTGPGYLRCYLLGIWEKPVK